MKKLLLAMIIAAVLSTSPAFALFVNGGFETGDFSGWTLTGTGAGLSAVMSASSPNQPGQTVDVKPYVGNYFARINDINGNYHETTLSQSDTIKSIDLSETLYVNWGAALIEPSNVHPEGDQPFFSITVKKNGVVMDSFYADALTKQGGGWSKIGYNDGDLWYKSGQYSYKLSNFDVEDIIEISLYVKDCGWGGHGGFAFLDGIGTVDYSTVPEPATMVLFGLGLLGLAGVSRKK